MEQNVKDAVEYAFQGLKYLQARNKVNDGLSRILLGISEAHKRLKAERAIKTVFIDGVEITYTRDTIFLVQVGRGKGSYKVKYSFKGKPGSAMFHYNALNIGNGYKKRFVIEGKVLCRQLS